jgi:fengycin family lipopeptide synthetase D
MEGAVQDIQEKLAVSWQNLLDCGEVTGESDFFECGGTSIAAVYLAARVQDTFGVPLDALEVVLERTLGKISALIAARLAEAS